MKLAVEGISHAFGELEVLQDISFTVRQGEIFALIGPSGCGKSTLLGIMGGLLQPTRGRVVVRGEIPPDSLNPYTYIFQDFALLPWRSVAGNVGLPLEATRLSRRERNERVRAALERMGLGDFARAFPGQLSGGMRQRVGIARALVVNPAILLMDEPLSALDAQTRELLMEDFLDLWLRERTTAVYVTHNLQEALRIADHIAVFTRRPGQILEIVPVELPKGERTTPAAQAQLATLHDKLWGLIKNQAQDADREVLHV